MVDITQGEWLVGRTGKDKFEIEGGSRRVAIVDTFTNARFIAAAPAMYEALTAIIAHWRANDEKSFASDLATEAIVALAAAEGRG